jgi:hypothetical protein
MQHRSEWNRTRQAGPFFGKASFSRRSLLLAAFARAAAQEVTFSTSVDVVTLLATVRNRNGAIVNDLNQDDFVLEEDGRPQTIRYFSRESNIPYARPPR